MKRSPNLLLAITMLVILALACGSQAVTPSVISTGPATTAPVVIVSFTPEPSLTPTPIKPSTYNVGDVIQLRDHTIVLNSASITNNILKANFTVENTGSEPITISSIADFSVKDAEGTKMEQEFFDCGTSFDGSVIVGDKLKGDICWSLLQAKAVPFKIYYQPNIFNADVTVVWVINP